jgi:hypothetical protein
VGQGAGGPPAPLRVPAREGVRGSSPPKREVPRLLLPAREGVDTSCSSQSWQGGLGGGVGGWGLGLRLGERRERGRRAGRVAGWLLQLPAGGDAAGGTWHLAPGSCPSSSSSTTTTSSASASARQPRTWVMLSGRYTKPVVVSTSAMHAVNAQASLNSGRTTPAASFSASSFQKPCAGGGRQAAGVGRQAAGVGQGRGSAAARPAGSWSSGGARPLQLQLQPAAPGSCSTTAAALQHLPPPPPPPPPCHHPAPAPAQSAARAPPRPRGAAGAAARAPGWQTGTGGSGTRGRHSS